ncbi:hypothetical protein GGS23DRAFT_511898 [Durotheca rogersii]|uniref:uncharacterized protein n=1 Tax=Durotheca rogersii TaxID=419775 RepID=UPI0022208C44|nr:uncharacterized protein GGS23DRAFT_511898 [Durotheca rogersii]KAI5863736.1 hypothetical protein GGS23DRAFT_511898 [Durotheca rogersii]
MASDMKTCVRCLQSVGSMTTDEGLLCLLSQADGRLVEKVFEKDQLRSQRRVASDPREDTSAAYIVTEHQAFIVYIGESNQLQCSAFVRRREKWKPVALKGLGDVVVHPTSRVSGTPTPNGAVVFYQDTDGAICTVRYIEETNSWEKGMPVSTNARIGTPICTFASDKAVVVSVVNEDGDVCCHVRDFGIGEWTETIIPNSRGEEPVTNILVTQDMESGRLEAFVLGKAEVVKIGEDGNRVTLGSVSSSTGVFEPASAAESALRIFRRLFEGYEHTVVYHHIVVHNYETPYYGSSGYVYYGPWDRAQKVNISERCGHYFVDPWC